MQKLLKLQKIVVNSKDLNKKKLGPLAGVLKAQRKKKTEKKKNNEKTKPKEKEEQKEKEISKDTKKRFIEAGVFDALSS